MRFKDGVSRLATTSSNWAGSSPAIVMMIISMILYLLGGFVFGFAESYQLVWNTFMSAVSYILLFLVQHTQNRESKALHLKVDEIILKMSKADNRLIGIEELTEDQLATLSARYKAIQLTISESNISS